MIKMTEIIFKMTEKFMTEINIETTEKLRQIWMFDRNFLMKKETQLLNVLYKNG